VRFLSTTPPLSRLLPLLALLALPAACGRGISTNPRRPLPLGPQSDAEVSPDAGERLGPVPRADAGDAGGHKDIAPATDADPDPPPAWPADGPPPGSWHECAQLGVGWMSAMAASPRGDLAAIGYSGRKIALVRPSDGQPVRELQMPEVWAEVMAFSSDGTQLAAGGMGSPVMVWRVADGALVAKLATGFGQILTIAFATSGEHLLVTGLPPPALGDSVQLYRLPQGTLVKTAGRDVQNFTATAGFGPDTASVVVLNPLRRTVTRFGLDGASLGSGSLPAGLTRTDLAPDGKTVLAMTSDQGSPLEARSLATGKVLWRSEQFFLPQIRLFYMPDEPRLIVADPNAIVVRYRLDTGAVASRGELPQNFDPQAMQADGQNLIGPSNQRGVRVPTSGGLESIFFERAPGHAWEITALAVSGDGRTLASGIDDPSASVWIWRLGRPGPLHPLDPQRLTSGYRMELSQDGSLLAAATPERRVYRASDGQLAYAATTATNAGPGMGTTMRFSPDGKWLAAGGPGPVVHVFDATTGAFLWSGASAVNQPAVAFSPDGATMATSGPELWRLSDHQALWPKEIHPANPPADARYFDDRVDFLPDGKSLLVSNCSCDGTFSTCGGRTRVVRAADGGMIADHGDKLGCGASLSPDGARAVAVDRMLDLAKGVVSKLPVAGRGVSRFLPDWRIVVGGTDGVVRILCPAP
jgi:WD40 repeat protein